MESNTNPLPAIQSLAHDAKIYAAKFMRDLKSAAAAACPTQGGLDFLGVLDTDAEYALRHPAIQDPDGAPGVLIPFPRPIRVKADMVPATASAARIHQANKQDSEATGFLIACAQLKTALLEAVGPHIREELEHPDDGHSQLSILQIKQHVAGKYGTMLECDITDVTSKLDIFPATASLSGFIVSSLTIHRVLLSNCQPKSELEKCQAFERALQQRFQFLPLIDLYKRSVPLLKNRTYAALAAYCEEHESSPPSFIHRSPATPSPLPAV